MRIVLVPGTLALLPRYAGQVDPVPELRSACLDAVSWLTWPVDVLASTSGRQVGEHLLRATSPRERGGADPQPTSCLVVGNGSAKRSEKAPGHLDPRAAGFDDALGRALRERDIEALAGLDPDLARDLWADTEGIAWLATFLSPEAEVSVDYDDDPFGVQYWVIRWEQPDPDDWLFGI